MAMDIFLLNFADSHCHATASPSIPTSQLHPEVLLCIGVNGFQCPSGYGGVKECLGEGNKGHCDLEMPM